MKFKRYFSLILVVSMLLSVLSVPVASAATGTTDFAWIEAADMTRGGGSKLGLISSSIAGAGVSGADYLRVDDATAPSDPNGYYADSEFSVETEGTYDIFVRGSWNTYSTNNASHVEFSVDGTVCSDVSVMNNEGWINPNTSGNKTWPLGWQKATVNLTAGDHTFRWAIKTVNGSGKYMGILDVVVIVPNGCGFEPVPVSNVADSFPVANVVNYELCTLLSGTNLTNLTTHLSLPTTTAGGHAVVWTTSDATVIGADGRIKPSNEEKTATLTATITADGTGYTRSFSVTLAKAVNDFAWIEASDMTRGGGSKLGLISSSIAGAGVSGADYLRVDDATAPSDSNGYYADSEFSVETEGTYDIFVRGSWNTYSTNNASHVEFSVDGTVCSDVSVMNNEGWINPNTSGNKTWPLGWQKATVNLGAGDHTFRWAIKTVNGSNKYMGILDVVVIIPNSCGFVPTPVASATETFPVKNVMDYELCSILTGVNLINLETDLELPTTTVGGYVVTWTTSDATVIGADGKINPTSKVKNATLTAKISENGINYTKNFAISLAGVEAEITDFVWMEAEDATPDSGSGLSTISGAADSTYQTLSGLAARRISSGTATGIGINFDFAVNTTQSYDIFVHGTYEVNSSYMSTVNMFVDETKSDVTNLISEGWIIKGSSGNLNFQVGWQKVTMTLTAGDHTFRWQVDGKGSSASTNKALCDVVIVVPTSAGFNPTRLDTADSLFPVKNSMDFELCSILTGVSLTNLETDLDLPTTTVGGYAVTWTTSDASVIGTDGKINPSTKAKSATLTATITASGVNYTKDFVVTLAGLATDYNWIEAKDMTRGGGSSLSLIASPTAGAGVSGTDYLRVNTGTAPSGSNGYYADSEFSVKTAGSYDIFIRGSWYSYSTDYASPVELSVDGIACEDVSVMNNEGWLYPNAIGSTNWPMGWQRATVNITAGSHIFRWAIKSANERENNYRGILDAIVIVPSGCGFVPTPAPSATDAFPEKNVTDFQLCANGQGTITGAAPYIIEAESYTDTNWKNSSGNIISTSDTMRGGKYVTLYNNPAVDTEYHIEYQVQVPTAGYYRMDVASTPPKNSGWSSRIYAQVNAGVEYELNTDATVSPESSLTLYQSDAVYLRKGLNAVRFIVKERVDTGIYVCRIDYFALSSAEVALSGIYADVPYMVFENDKDVVPYVQANGFVPSDVTVNYVVTDYHGTQIKAGNAVIPAGERRGNINLGRLANGYYKITATYEGVTVQNDISVVVPLTSRKAYVDTPFAIDTNFYALYSKYSEEKDLLTDYVGALNLLGTSWIRDRLTLEDATLADTGDVSVNVSKNNNIGNIVKNNSNIKISTVVNGLPTWIETDYSKFGTDYNLVYKLFKALGTSIGNNVDALEILNETDHGGSGTYDRMGADIYASFAKAATVGIKDSDSNAFVITQGNARYPDNPGKYSETLYDNGLFDYVSADNYHAHVMVGQTYSEPYTAFAGMTGNKIVDNLKKQYGKDAPVWITEAGYLIENAAGEELKGGELERQAKYLVTSTVESLATGVDKHFYFLGTVYDETSTSTEITYTTGIMNKNKKYPGFYPAYSAMSAMTYVLGEGQYKGKLSSDGVYAYAFEDGSDTILVLYSEGTAKDYNVKLSCNTATKYDMFANSQVISSNNGTFTVSVSSEPVYLKFNGNIGAELDVSYADELITLSDRTLTDADRIVISQEYSSTSKENARSSGYYINNYNKTVTVTVTNLNSTAKTVTINGTASNDWSVTPATQTVTVDAYGTATMTFTINVNEKSYDSKISFVGTIDGENTSASTAYAYGGFAGVEFVNADGKILYEFNENAKNYARLTLNNKNSLNKKNVKVYVAAYDETQNLLVNLFETSLDVNLLQSKTVDIEIPYSEEANAYKVFVWDPNLSPYSRPYRLQADMN